MRFCGSVYALISDPFRKKCVTNLSYLTWLALSRMGGQHLNCVAPDGMFSEFRVR